MRPALLLLLLGAGLAAGCSSSGGAGPEGSGRRRTEGTASVATTVAWRPVDLSRPLTLESCVHLVLDNAPDLATFQARVEAARSLVTTAETWPNPIVTVFGQDIGAHAVGRHQELFQQHLLYPAFFWVTRGLQQDVARANLEGVRLGVADERRLVAGASGQAYLDAVAEEELASIEADATAVASEVRKLVDKRTELGDASPIEADRARAEELDALRGTDFARERRTVAGVSLALLLGASEESDVKLAPAPYGEESLSLLASVAGDSDDVARARLVEAAFERRPDLDAARARLEQLDLVRSLEERRAYSIADATVAIGMRESSISTGGFLALNLPLPLFDRNQGGRSRAEADFAGGIADLERVRRRVRAEVTAAFTQWRRSQQRLARFVVPLVEARTRAATTARRLFEAGEIAYQELMLTERDALAARRAVVFARREVAGARWRVVVACGAIEGLQIDR